MVSIVEGMKADPELRDALKLPPFDYDTMLPQETPVPTPESEYDANKKPVLEKNLKKNSEGETVYWVQRRLTELGYYTGWCSGKILNGTAEALRAFQRANGLGANGEVNQKTLDALYEAGRPTPAPTVTPESTPSPAGK